MPKAQRLAAGLASLTLIAFLTACSSGGAVVTVNGKAITKGAFDDKLESSPVAKQVLSQMVQTQLLEQYAADNHVDVSDADINAKENQLKSQYGAAQFDQMLKARGLSETDVHNAIRDQIIVDKAVGKDIKISNADIAKFFKANHVAYDKPDQVQARHILVHDLPTANMIEGKLKAGQPFDALAKQYSQDPSTKDKGGELGWFRRGQMVPSFEAAAFKQPIGAIGPPVKSPFGYHIIQVEARQAGQKATLTTAHDQIVEQLRQQQEAPLIQPFLQSLLAKASITVNDPRYADVFPSPAPGASTAPAK